MHKAPFLPQTGTVNLPVFPHVLIGLGTSKTLETVQVKPERRP